ncbi:hypothetical protein EDC37_11087 [Pectinatus cerevisiiphilus]|uniref:Uncharacterized protein n=1 Tax=Pectinatus cerevisiiphilus TaxID=86956 RepID=A0A4R3K6Y6_9FIRM|nr:hypothetical protein EDC37_11087 [Pectinatus cerevisiiphilus]
MLYEYGSIHRAFFVNRFMCLIFYVPPLKIQKGAFGIISKLMKIPKAPLLSIYKHDSL